MPAGYVTLGKVAAAHTMLAIACNRCDRLGRLRLDRLVAEHGADLPVPELRRILAVDCPRMIEGKMHDPCGVHFPGLNGLTD